MNCQRCFDREAENEFFNGQMRAYCYMCIENALAEMDVNLAQVWIASQKLRVTDPEKYRTRNDPMVKLKLDVMDWLDAHRTW